MVELVPCRMAEIANPIQVPRLEEFTTCSLKMGPNFYLNYVTREDDCSRDRLEDRLKPPNFYPDLVESNNLWTREEYELSLEGWYPPTVTVEFLIGSPTDSMVTSLANSYKWVRTLFFEQRFSSVFAIMKLVSALENCQEVTITLDNKNVEQSAVDRASEAFGCPYLYSIRTKSVRSLAVVKSPVAKDPQPWLGFNSRANLIAKCAFIVFECMERFKMDVYGDVSKFQVIRNTFFGRTKYPQGFLTHSANFGSYNNSILVDVCERRNGYFSTKQNTTAPRVPAPTLPSYMLSNTEFMKMRFYQPKKRKVAEQMKAKAAPNINES